jgi:hypothetical protein
MKNTKDFLDKHSKLAAVVALTCAIIMLLVAIMQEGLSVGVISTGSTVILFVVWFFLVTKKKKVAEAKNAEPEIEGEEATPFSSSICDVDRYKVDENDSNLFHSPDNKDFSIRVMKNGADKDSWTFALSLPHKFDANDKELMLATLPNITDVIWDTDSHCIKICKSPACNFVDLQDYILRFLFLHLQRKYGWMSEAQEVRIERVDGGDDVLSFNLRVQTYQHVGLGRILFGLEGIVQDSQEKGFPLCMDHQGRYEILIHKAKAYSWNELLPKIKKVFTDYFKGGVNFIDHRVIKIFPGG